jgi:hypothetical protein
MEAPYFSEMLATLLDTLRHTQQVTVVRELQISQTLGSLEYSTRSARRRCLNLVLNWRKIGPCGL